MSTISNIAEIFECGPIVFVNEDLGVVITINGSYLNWWNVSDKVDCRDARSTDGKPFHEMTWVAAMDAAEEWFNEVIANEDDEGSGDQEDSEYE